MSRILFTVKNHVNIGIFASVLFLVAVFILFLFPYDAEAGAIINRPLAIGLNQGLVGHWTFDGKDMIGGQTARDISGQGNNGTLTNGPVKASGRIGQALEFDGVDDVVSAGSDTSLDNLTALTVSAWIFAKSSGENGLTGRIVDKAASGSANGWLFFQTTNNVGGLRFFVDGTTDLSRISSDNVIKYNKWEHVLVTWDGSATAANALIYVNGVEVSYTTTTNGAGRTNDASSVLRIGNDVDGIRTWDGLIDDVRVYNRALSQDEIKRLYNLGGTFTVNKSQNTGTLKDGLVGHWTFDGKDMIGGQTARDISGQGNNGTLTNGPVKASGRIGQALEFDGVNDYVSLPYIAAVVPPNLVTYCAWTNIRTAGNFETFVINGSNVINQSYILQIANGATQYAFAVWGGSYNAAGGTVTFNTWTHLCGTFDGTTMILYKNGVQVASDNTGTVTTPSELDNGLIGAGVLPTDFLIDGLIDDVRVYNRVLSQDEIKRLYNLGGTFTVNKSQNTGTLKDGLVGHWTFDGKDMIGGQTARDISGQGNNGTLTNGPNTAKGRIGQALSFDGVDDFVNIPTKSVFDMDNITVSAWAYFKDVNVDRSIVMRSRSTSPFGWGIRINGNTKLDFTIAVGVTEFLTEAASLPSTNIWHHVVGTYDGETSRLYLDNVEVASNATPSGNLFNPTDQNVSIGDTLPFTPRFFNGLIDDVRIYNRALSADEIKRLYNMGL